LYEDKIAVPTGCGTIVGAARLAFNLMPAHRGIRRRVSYALGYIGLGMFAEAELELEALDPADQELPEVASVRVDLHLAARQWRAAIAVASNLAWRHPECESSWIGWAYALRELNQVEEARVVLLSAEVHHGKVSAVLHYNLACYDALLGSLESARQRLARACKLDARFKEAARDDPDLKALRNDPKM